MLHYITLHCITLHKMDFLNCGKFTGAASSPLEHQVDQGHHRVHLHQSVPHRKGAKRHLL